MNLACSRHPQWYIMREFYEPKMLSLSVNRLHDVSWRALLPGDGYRACSDSTKRLLGGLVRNGLAGHHSSTWCGSYQGLDAQDKAHASCMLSKSCTCADTCSIFVTDGVSPVYIYLPQCRAIEWMIMRTYAQLGMIALTPRRGPAFSGPQLRRQKCYFSSTFKPKPAAQ
jgi:hypothetical protein